MNLSIIYGIAAALALLLAVGYCAMVKQKENWLVEQLVHWEFEFLAISYIVSELLLLLLYGMIKTPLKQRRVPRPGE